MPLKKILKSLKVTTRPVSGKSEYASQAKAYSQTLHREAVIGGQLFGPIPSGHRREFFCLDERTWIWHEEWLDNLGQHRSKTTRYDVRPDGVLKAQDGQPYKLVELDEAQNLVQAARLYRDRVRSELYSFL